ncbi:unnamed protein product [Didymodactylos carnosus]|uniref:Uncharacterized protein n=1 Tax=Didymodactylos carnosus TaxID=1234261 RepID=A0A814T606_9BILA|nr:unnamed protein product [Didymodactylos carnosus]CAF3920492.1 unnamed protein product [Didymodactylos carnosus]
MEHTFIEIFSVAVPIQWYLLLVIFVFTVLTIEVSIETCSTFMNSTFYNQSSIYACWLKQEELIDISRWSNQRTVDDCLSYSDPLEKKVTCVSFIRDWRKVYDQYPIVSPNDENRDVQPFKSVMIIRKESEQKLIEEADI